MWLTASFSMRHTLYFSLFLLILSACRTQKTVVERDTLEQLSVGYFSGNVIQRKVEFFGRGQLDSDLSLSSFTPSDSVPAKLTVVSTTLQAGDTVRHESRQGHVTREVTERQVPHSEQRFGLSVFILLLAAVLLLLFLRRR